MVGAHRIHGVLVATLLLAGCLSTDRTDSLSEPSPPPGGFTATSVFPGTYDHADGDSHVLAPGPHRPLPDLVVELPSERDGAAIQIGVVRPDVPEGRRVPVILHASPYHPIMVEGHLLDMEKASNGTDIEAWFLIDNFVPHGFAVAFVAIRGTGGSGGCWDWYGEAERADIAQAATWLAGQPWNSGSIGAIGRSFASDTTWELAAEGHPALRTLVAIKTQPDAYTWVVRNGTVSHAAPGGWATPAYFDVSTGDVQTDPARKIPAYTDGAPRLAGRACPDKLEAMRTALLLTATPDRGTGFWAERDLRPAVLANYNGSVLIAQGFADGWAPPHLAEPFASQLIAKGLAVKRLYDHSGHGNPDTPTPSGDPGDTRWGMPAPYAPRWDWAEILLHWFDHWLRGAVSADLGPRVQVADSTGQWRSEDAWPPADANVTRFELGLGGTLGPEAVGTGTVRLLPDAQRALLNLDQHAPTGRVCPSCAEFATEPFDNELRFAGAGRLPLTVVPQGPGGHVTADLFAETPNGERARLTWGQIDLRYADGGETARPVNAGVALTVRMELEPTDAVVPAGARLVLVLSQGGYGDRLPVFYYRASAPTYPVDVVVGEDASALKLLTFQRGAETFFDPPA